MTNKFTHTKGILDASHKGAWEIVGGIPLVARNIYHLIELNIKEIILLVSKDVKIYDLTKWKGDSKIVYKYIKKSVPESISEIKDNIVYIDSSYLFDKRIIEKVISSSPNTIFFKNPQDKNTPKLAILDETGIKIWAKNGLQALLEKANPIYLNDIDPFSIEMRGKVDPYVIQVTDKKSAKEATFILIKNMQKKVMDLPAEYIDPFFENYLTYLLCNTPITPNIVTLFSLFVAIIIAFLFWNGHFVLGAFCTYIVEILDGVDGKLARTKLQFSKFGEYECLIDYFYENLWYIAIGVGLKNVYHKDMAVIFSTIMIISDTIDNIAYTLSNKWLKKNLDLLSPFDMAFRKIAGRRNIYSFMFMIGFSLGYYFQTFIIASIWAAVTAIIHTVRLIQNKTKA